MCVQSSLNHLLAITNAHNTHTRTRAHSRWFINNDLLQMNQKYNNAMLSLRKDSALSRAMLELACEHPKAIDSASINAYCSKTGQPCNPNWLVECISVPNSSSILPCYDVNTCTCTHTPRNTRLYQTVSCLVIFDMAHVIPVVLWHRCVHQVVQSQPSTVVHT